MKKTINFLIIILLSIFSVAATTSWASIQGLEFSNNQTLTMTYIGISSAPISSQSNGTGVVLSGTRFSSEESSLGLGYQIGATLTEETTTDGETSSLDLEDQPLAWMGSLSTQYRLKTSSFLNLEIGLGLLFESSEDSIYNSYSESTITITSDTLSTLISATLLANLTNDWFLIGGVDCLLPLYANIELTDGVDTLNIDVDSEGYS